MKNYHGKNSYKFTVNKNKAWFKSKFCNEIKKHNDGIKNGS